MLHMHACIVHSYKAQVNKLMQLEGNLLLFVITFVNLCLCRYVRNNFHIFYFTLNRFEREKNEYLLSQL